MRFADRERGWGLTTQSTGWDTVTLALEWPRAPGS